MNLSVIMLLIIIGLVAGALSGMMGIGGAIVMIPAMVYLLHMSQHQAIGTSLAVMLPPIGLFAAYNFYKAGNVNVIYAIILAIAFIIGSYYSSKIALKIPEEGLRKGFSIFMILFAIKMFFSK